MFTQNNSPDWGLTVDWPTGQRVPAKARRRPQWSPPPVPGILPKRPLGFFEVLDGGFRLMRRYPALTYGSAGIGAGLTAGVFALAGAVTWYFGHSFFTKLLDSSEEALSGLSFVVQISAGIVEYLTLAALIVFSGLASIGAREAFFGRTMSLRQAWQHLRGSRRKLFGAALLMGTAHLIVLAVFLAAAILAGAVGGTVIGLTLGTALVLVWWALTVFFGIRLSLTGCIIAQERVGTFTAIARSWKMTGRGFFQVAGQTVFGFWLANQVIGVIATPAFIYLGGVIGVLSILMLGGGEFEGPIVAAVLGTIFTGLLLAIGVLLYAYRAALLATVYFNLRMRSEGYDLVLLAEAEEV